MEGIYNNIHCIMMVKIDQIPKMCYMNLAEPDHSLRSWRSLLIDGETFTGFQISKAQDIAEDKTFDYK